MDMVAHIYNPVPWEAKAGGFSIWGQLGLNDESKSL